MMKNYAVLDKDSKVLNIIVAPSLEAAESATSSFCVLIPLGTFVDFGYHYFSGYFYSPQPYPSWTRNQGNWEAPTPMPVEEGKRFAWDENTLAWVEVETE